MILGEQVTDSLSENRMAGKQHIIPALPCLLCASEVDIVEEEMVYFIECPECGLLFGGPHGYSSRLDLVGDWNKRL